MTLDLSSATNGVLAFGARRHLAQVIMVSLAACVGQALQAGDEPTRVTVDADYPGGNIIVEQVTPNTVHLRQDLRDTKTWWFYWNFRVRHAGDQKKIRFQFAGQNPIGVLGPAVSKDQGRTWTWLGSEAVHESAFDYLFANGDDDVRFAFAMPYQRHDLDRFIASHDAARRGGRLEVSTLCKSRKGRDVPLVRLMPMSGRSDRRVLVAARHHACESMASYVLEGLLDSWLTKHQKNDAMSNVQIVAIPLVDYDGVEDGDQGKNRQPRDHNRDYGSDGIYMETRAIRQLVGSWSETTLDTAVDLHCPWIRGKHNDVIYMVGSSDKRIAAEQSRFGRILQAVCAGTLKYQLKDNIAFGTAWNTDANYKQGVSFARWAGSVEGVRLAATFEIPYASAGGQAVTPESARTFGRELADAIVEYLELPHQSSTQ